VINHRLENTTCTACANKLVY